MSISASQPNSQIRYVLQANWIGFRDGIDRSQTPNSLCFTSELSDFAVEPEAQIRYVLQAKMVGAHERNSLGFISELSAGMSE